MKFIKKYLKYRKKEIIEHCARIAENAYDRKNPTLHGSGKNIGKLIRRFDGD